jgi:hypothetical protein
MHSKAEQASSQARSREGTRPNVRDDRMTELVTERLNGRGEAILCRSFFTHTHHHTHDLPPLPCGTGVAMARSQAAIIFAVALVANVLLLRQSALTSVAVQQHDLQDFGAGRSLFRRGLFTTESGESGENVRPYHPSGLSRNSRFIDLRIVLTRPVLRRTLNGLTSSV